MTKQIEVNINLTTLKKELKSTLSDIKKEKVLLAIFAEYKDILTKQGYIKLGGALGVIYLVRSLPTKKRVLNYALSKELGRKVYLSNLHSDDYVYRIKWSKGRFVNNRFYKFKPARKTTRQLATQLKIEEPVLINPKNFK
jgi:hypothetical protein